MGKPITISRKVVSVKASKLIWDTDIYPRENVDSVNMKSIEMALRAGVPIDPIVADRKSNRIVDGVHRWKVYRRVRGDDCDVPVEYRSYTNENMLWLDAVNCNKAHGRQFSPFEKVKIIEEGNRRKIKIELIAAALSMPQGEVTVRSSRVAFMQGTKERVVLKHGFRRLAGKEINQAQAKENDGYAGRTVEFYIKQVLSAIRAEAIDLENQHTLKLLTELHECLDEVLETAKA